MNLETLEAAMKPKSSAIDAAAATLVRHDVKKIEKKHRLFQLNSKPSCG